jgi:hypothetical protein
MRLVGTTKPTIAQIRDRTHWNSSSLVPQDPVTLGLCSQTDLDAEVQKAARRMERERREHNKELAKSGTLLPTEETTAPPPVEAKPFAEILQPKVEEQPAEESETDEAARILAKLRGLPSKPEQAEDEE